MSTAVFAGASEQASPAEQDLALHVARRLTFGPTPEVVAEILSSGIDRWIDQQLRPGSIADAEADAIIVRLTGLLANASDLRLANSFGDRAVSDLRVAALVRAVRSRRQLLELMTDFWHDHLVVSAAKGAAAWHVPAYDRNVIRPHALGRFADLLRVATRSPAMLEYLDNAGSRTPDVNENHGRELLELHTVGPGSGYGEDDVAGAARVLSGWTIDPQTLTTTFDANRHDAGPAAVLGWSTPGRTGQQGAADLDRMLDHLAHHPATAARLANRLARRFVSDTPSRATIDSTAAAYLAHGTDIAATLRHLFATPEFRAGGGPLLRRPFDLLAGLLRATNATLDVETTIERIAPLQDLTDPVLPGLLGPVMDVTGVVDPAVPPSVATILNTLVGQRALAVTVTRLMRLNDQHLFAAPHPSGNPLGPSSWRTGDALLRRWSLGAQLAQNRLDGISLDPVALAGGATTIGAAVDTMARRLTGSTPSAPSRAGAVAVAGAGEGDAPSPGQLGDVLAFLLSVPEVQLR